MQKGKRNSRIELLRVMAMFFIVGSHCARYSTKDLWGTEWMNTCFLMALGVWGQLGVAIFVTITSYFAVDNVIFKFRKVAEITLKTWMYSILLTVIYCKLSGNRIEGKDLIFELLSPFSNQYWFISSYLLFFFALPFLYYFQQQVSQEQLGKLCITMIGLSFFFSSSAGNLFKFVLIYFVVAYIKRSKLEWSDKYAPLCVGYCLGFITVLCTLASLRNGIGWKNIYAVIDFLTSLNIFVIVMALMLFYFCIRGKAFYNKWVNRIGSSVLACYILSENLIFRNTGSHDSLLWQKIFQCDRYFPMPWFPLYYIGAVFSVMAVCIAVDWILHIPFLGIVRPLLVLAAKFDRWYLER